jgi:hypothetical protein
MSSNIVFSHNIVSLSWSELDMYSNSFGSKAAGLLALPKPWTLPFLAIGYEQCKMLAESTSLPRTLGREDFGRIKEFAENHSQLIVRSSVVGETIWDRGKYKSVVVEIDNKNWQAKILDGIKEILSSCSDRSCGVVVQRFERPLAKGEFGNLLRISKTKDHWELSGQTENKVSKIRFNSQRDIEADITRSLNHQKGLSQEWTYPEKVEGLSAFYFIAAIWASNVIGDLYPKAECLRRGL